MSRAMALVKFNKTKNIYWGCYDGTCDIMYAKLIPLITPNDDYDMDNFRENVPIANHTDVDDIEIYSDYGSGFYWNGKGSETSKCITSGFAYDIDSYINGIPDWAEWIFDNRYREVGNE